LCVDNFPKGHYSGRTKAYWKFSCGNNKYCEIKSVVNGYTKSCGCWKKSTNKSYYNKPKYLSKDEWAHIIPEIVITDDLPDKWCKTSRIEISFRCKCGNIFTRKMSKYKPGISTCTKCDYIICESLKGKKFGDLEFIDEREGEFHKNSEMLFKFKCSCGNICEKALSSVQRGFTTSCGNCNLLSVEYLKSAKFGKLQFTNITGPIKSGSEKEHAFKCNCGQTCYKKIYDVVRGHTKSCGSCLSNAKKWLNNRPQLPDRRILIDNNIEYYDGCHKDKEWLELAIQLFKLSDIAKKCNINTATLRKYRDKFKISNKCEPYYALDDLENYFNGSTLQPLENIKSQNEKSTFLCKLCGNKFKTKLSYIVHNNVVSCGCSGSSYSMQSETIDDYIRKLGIDCYSGSNEFKINQYKYDIYIKSHNLIIEYNGLKWHNDNTKENDIVKFKLAADKGFDYLMIYEDEWTYKTDIIKNIIRNKLNINNPRYRIRPQNCDIKLISKKESSKLLDDFHIQGSSNAKFHIGVYHKNKLISCMCIKKPTRQSHDDWELSRMVTNFDYRVYGIWSYLLKWIKQNGIINGKMSTFSDNRVSNGNVYESIGMEYEKSVRPYYYWVKNLTRHHKSGLRKTAEEKNSNATEFDLRTNQGYNRIWDLGKKKWSIFV